MKVQLFAGDPTDHTGKIEIEDAEVDETMVHLGPYAGNVYLYVDEEEWGSLYFYMKDGKLRIGLGQYDADADEWVFRSELTHPVVNGDKS